MSQNLDTRSLQQESLPAAIDRLVNEVVGEGVWDKAGGSYQVVEQASANMTVRVGSGTAGDLAVVQGEASLQGRYLVQNQDAYAGNAAADLTIAEGDPSDDRIDLVVLQVYDDPFDSSGSNVSQLEVVEGTPASSPSAPTVPDSALVLAEILVAANESTSIVDGDITDRRVQARVTDELHAGDGSTSDPGLETITASTSYGANGVTQASVEIEHGTRVLVHHSCLLRANGASNAPAQSVAISGDNTVAADSDWSASVTGSELVTVARSHLFTGLTPGTSTFTLVYQSGSGTDTGSVRQVSLVVQPL